MQASVQKIIGIKDIENADSIEKAYVLGWQVVVKKGEFEVNGPCVFVSIDSVLPDKPEFAFLAKSKFRVRTIRLRGCLSQGIVFPLDILPAKDKDGTSMIWEQGQDVSEILGVTHYEKPVPAQLAGESKGNFPPICPRTDEERIQNIPEVLNELRGKSYIITEKVDGTSCTIYFNRGEFGVCSRNMEKKDGQSVYWQIARKYDLEKKLRASGRNIAIQGEVCGPGIQKNKLGLKELNFFVFDIYDIEDGKYITPARLPVFVRSLELPSVPLVEMGQDFAYELDNLLEKAKGKYAGTENQREGIVVRGLYGDFSETMRKRISFKVLNNVFLEQEKE